MYIHNVTTVHILIYIICSNESTVSDIIKKKSLDVSCAWLVQYIKYKRVTLYICDSFYYVVERKRVTGLAWLIGYFGVCSGSPAPGESASNCHVDRLFLTRLIDRQAESIDWRTLYRADLAPVTAAPIIIPGDIIVTFSSPFLHEITSNLVQPCNTMQLYICIIRSFDSAPSLSKCFVR